MLEQNQSFWRLAAYAAPGYITAVLLFSTSAIIPTFYVKHAGLSLTLVGSIIAVSRLFDAVTDPAIGYLSDITKSRLGSRRPWIIAGFALAMVAMYFLYVPPASVDAYYFATWLFVFYIAFTMITIPHLAWGTEISRQYEERSRISTYVGLSGQLGTLTFALIPLIPIFASQGYNAETLKFIAIFYIFLMPIIAFISVRYGAEGAPVATESPSIMGLFQSVKGNKPFWVFILGASIGGLGGGIFFATIFLYTDSYLQLGNYFPYVLVIDAVATFVAIPLWLKMIFLLGKHRTFSIGFVSCAVVMFAMAFIPPGEEFIMLFLVLVGVRAAAIASYYVLPMSILGDVIDYDILKTGVNRSANYFSVYTLVSKTTAALGAGVGFIIIGAFGYKVGGDNSDFANQGIIFSALVLPAIMMIISALVYWYFPIDRERHSIIMRKINKRMERVQRAKKTLE